MNKLKFVTKSCLHTLVQVISLMQIYNKKMIYANIFLIFLHFFYIFSHF